MAAILVLQNNETAAMLVYQTNPVGVQPFSYANTCGPINLHGCWTREYVRSKGLVLVWKGETQVYH